MAKKKRLPVNSKNEVVPFTCIPNQLIRSQLLSVYDKMVYCAIASCDPSFPSYEKLMEWTGLSRGRVWKSLTILRSFRIISWTKQGKVNKYVNHLMLPAHRLLESQPVHQTNSRSSPHELEPVHQVNAKKNKEKEQIKKISNETHVSLKTEERGLAEVMKVLREIEIKNKVLVGK